MVDIVEEGGYHGPADSFIALSQDVFEEVLSSVQLLEEGISVGGHIWFKPNICTVAVMQSEVDKIIEVSCVSYFLLLSSIH